MDAVSVYSIFAHIHQCSDESHAHIFEPLTNFPTVINPWVWN